MKLFINERIIEEFVQSLQYGSGITASSAQSGSVRDSL
jgi:hypothetical protein